MTRHELRECIFKILFQIPFLEEEAVPSDVLKDAAEGKSVTEKAADSLGDEEAYFIAELELGTKGYLGYDKEMSEEDSKYIRKKVDDIRCHITEIDNTLKDLSGGKGLDWYGKPELAILRLAVYEIQVDEDIPAKVAVNEAVELAKVYCDPKAAPLINGILSGLL